MNTPQAVARPRSGLYHRMMARFYDHMMADYEAWIEARKRTLFSGVSGRVIEVGPGTGNNFRHLPATIEWLGIEPNPYMHESLRQKAHAAGIKPRLHAGVTALVKGSRGTRMERVVAALLADAGADRVRH